jgi:hypothetical protein
MIDAETFADMSAEQFYDEYGEFVLEYEEVVTALEDIIQLIPVSQLSAGDYDALREHILQWRKERGYGTPS